MLYTLYVLDAAFMALSSPTSLFWLSSLRRKIVTLCRRTVMVVELVICDYRQHFTDSSEHWNWINRRTKSFFRRVLASLHKQVCPSVGRAVDNDRSIGNAIFFSTNYGEFFFTRLYRYIIYIIDTTCILTPKNFERRDSRPCLCVIRSRRNLKLFYFFPFYVSDSEILNSISTLR